MPWNRRIEIEPMVTLIARPVLAVTASARYPGHMPVATISFTQGMVLPLSNPRLDQEPLDMSCTSTPPLCSSASAPLRSSRDT